MAYTHGAEPWIEVSTRGRTARFPACTSILAVVEAVNSRSPYPER